MADDQVRYVSKNGNDANDGITIPTAKLTVKSAVLSLPTVGSGGNFRHEGTVMVGAGTFEEDGDIEFNENLSVVGAGRHRTTIKLKNSANTHLFSFSAGFTDWGHGLHMSDLTLDGNKANNVGNFDLVRMFRPAFNASINRVQFDKAPRYGINIIDNAVNFYMFDCTGSFCETAWLHFRLDNGANLANVGLFGLQIDMCGPDAIHIESNTGGGGNTIFIIGLETEVSSEEGQSTDHNNVIRYTPVGSTNGPTFVISNVNAWRAGSFAAGDAVVREDTGNPRAKNWILTNVKGDNYTDAFKGVDSGVTSIGNEILGTLYGAWFQNSNKGIQLGKVAIYSGDNSPDTAVTAPQGSMFLSTNGNIYRNTDGSTAWTAM